MTILFTWTGLDRTPERRNHLTSRNLSIEIDVLTGQNETVIQDESEVVRRGGGDWPLDEEQLEEVLSAAAHGG